VGGKLVRTERIFRSYATGEKDDLYDEYHRITECEFEESDQEVTYVPKREIIEKDRVFIDSKCDEKVEHACASLVTNLVTTGAGISRENE
jgi:hypothetical protein